MAPIIAALLVIMPGAAAATLSAPKASSPRVFICESIVWSLLLGSLYAWVPLGKTIPIFPFVGALFILSIFSSFLVLHRLRAAFPAFRPNRLKISWDIAPVSVLFIIYLIVLLQRGTIDWDAITYYFTVAVQFVLSGHATTSLYPYVSTVAGTLNTQPPIMPSIYANALVVGKILGSWPSNVVRLIPFVFIAGGYFATRELAGHYLPRQAARFAALLWLALPATVNAVCTYPLYLDIGFTFLCTYFIATLVEPAQSPSHYFRLGVIAATVGLFKVDGFALIVFAVSAVYLVRGTKVIGKFFSFLLAAALIGITVLVGLMHADMPIDLLLGVLISAAFFIAASGQSVGIASLSLADFAALLLGFSPGILRAIQLTITVGSPAGLYIPSLAKHISPQWHQAVNTLNNLHVYAASVRPGLPSHYALGLIFWWGISPVVGLLSGCFIFSALFNKPRLLEIVAILALFNLSYLTLFQYGGMRDLLPAIPLIVVLAIEAILNLFPERQMRYIASIVCLASSIPFAWNGQEYIFSASTPIMEALHWDAWNSFSTQGIVLMCIYSGLILSILIAVRHFFVKPLRISAEPASVKRQFEMSAGRRQYALGAPYVLIVIAIFIPFWGAAIKPGLAATASSLQEAEDYGYLPVLFPLLSDRGVRRILTYKAYGITWFSFGRDRRIDLVDATDLSHYRSALRHESPRELIRALDIQAMLIPARGSAEYATYRRVLRAFHYPWLGTLADPLIGIQGGDRAWSSYVFFKGTNVNSTAHLYAIAGNSHQWAISDVTGARLLSLRNIKYVTLTRFPRRWRNRELTISFTVTSNNGSPKFSAAETLHTRAGEISATIPLEGLFLAHRDTIKLLEIRISRTNGARFLDFRSEGVTFTSDRLRETIRGYPFLLHPGWNVVGSISLGRTPKRRVHLFPPPSSYHAGIGKPLLVIRVHRSPICPQPNRIILTLRILAGAAHHFGYEGYTVKAHVGRQMASFPLARFMREGQRRFKIYVSADSNGRGCDVHEGLLDRSLKLHPADNSFHVRFSQSAPFHELFVVR